MYLAIAQPGPLVSALAAAAGGDLVCAQPNDDDLFERALGRRAVIYVAAPSLLDAALNPAPSPERLRAVLHAAAAPGVEVIVAVFPDAQNYALEIEALRRHGKPYVVLLCPPLVEELAERLAEERDETVWLPRGAAARVSSADVVARAILDAVDTDAQGRVTDAPSEAAELTDAFGRAARLAGARVVGVPAWVHRSVRPLALWARRREPRALNLAERLTALAPPPEPRAA